MSPIKPCLTGGSHQAPLLKAWGSADGGLLLYWLKGLTLTICITTKVWRTKLSLYGNLVFWIINQVPGICEARFPGSNRRVVLPCFSAQIENIHTTPKTQAPPRQVQVLRLGSSPLRIKQPPGECVFLVVLLLQRRKKKKREQNLTAWERFSRVKRDKIGMLFCPG